MQRALAIRRAALATRGFATEAETSPSVIKVVRDLQRMHLESLDRMRAENEAFRHEIKGMFDKLSGEVHEVREQQMLLNSFVCWSVPVAGVAAAGLAYFL
ncbi:hypothetical protein MNEG_6743 [Monoraphidium neglectum]|uniref:Uncharacterized protein n=1 Tax=Monoraphidium neglectum TaxID=145388 RepID=A0A0D2JQ71_9CHLO|nr:hypothetical protein MNEG_6743 [Monoraphidium neglectum]KIZ01218.1 hypothetical protein MNEG_6743 [Monoraphidium neglectum]|eukprot:XP_013900237.1 hypothetical protein MNEG_6743 [Monoraphidium neglectum]